MAIRTVCLPLAAFALCLTPLSTSAESSFVGVGDLTGGSFSSVAYDVSDDGTTVVGSSYSTSGQEAFLWTLAGGIQPLGDLLGGSFESSAQAVSSDGTVVVGSGSSASGSEAFRWTAAEGMVGLGDVLEGFLTSSARAVSADGLAIVGHGTTLPSDTANFWWSAEQGAIIIAGAKVARDVSSDGSVVVGAANSCGAARFFFPFMWADDVEVIVPCSPSTYTAYAEGVSPDGSVVVGIGPPVTAFRWTEGSGSIGLGPNSGASDVSADGSVVVGVFNSIVGQEAFIWTAETGMQSLRQVLVQDFGLDVIDWFLTTASGVSADGRTIVGHGANPSGDTEGWVAVLDWGCSDGLDNDGDLLTDYPDDPGCDGEYDLSERSPSLVCDDGIDNDGDQLVDFPSDPGCDDPLDSSETSPTPSPTPTTVPTRKVKKPRSRNCLPARGVALDFGLYSHLHVAATSPKGLGEAPAHDVTLIDGSICARWKPLKPSLWSLATSTKSSCCATSTWPPRMRSSSRS